MFLKFAILIIREVAHNYFQIYNDKVMPYDSISANYKHHEWQGHAKLRDNSQNR